MLAAQPCVPAPSYDLGFLACQSYYLPATSIVFPLCWVNSKSLYPSRLHIVRHHILSSWPFIPKPTPISAPLLQVWEYGTTPVPAPHATFLCLASNKPVFLSWASTNHTNGLPFCVHSPSMFSIYLPPSVCSPNFWYCLCWLFCHCLTTLETHS